jgi:hypothetical protein
LPKQKSVGRLVYLDVFKTLLVYGMIGAHVIQLLGFGLKPWTARYGDFINLISFSGFMLAFGIGTGLQRKDGRKGSFGQRLWPILVMLAAVYVSSIAFVVLVDKKPLGIGLLLDLVTMRVLFGWSEFLATFLVLHIVIALTRPMLIKISEPIVLVVLLSALCLAATLVVSNADVPLLAAVIGTTRFASFPLIPYLPWFLIGLYLGRRGSVPNLWLFLPAIIATGAFVAYMWMHKGALPERFPPSAAWVAGSALPLMIYLVVSQMIGGRVSVPPVLLLPGRKVLRFLVLSNLMIFGTRYVFNKPVRDWPMILGVTLGIILVITLISLVLERMAPAKAGRR